MTEMTEKETPRLRVVRGNPDAMEVAALVAVLTQADSQAKRAPRSPQRTPETHWSTPAHVRRRYPRSWAASRLLW